MRFHWRALEDGGRWFVFSPRFGAVYRLGSTEVQNELLLKLLGLPETARAGDIVDPVTRVGLGGMHEKEVAPVEVAAWAKSESEGTVRQLAGWYGRLHRQRWRYTPASVEHWAGRVASAIASDTLDLERIGRLVALAELSAGVSDCYPRALLLSALCGRAGVGCDITIGILAPTRKLHAWCSADGTLLYEPTPRHWWYRPLANFRHMSANAA